MHPEVAGATSVIKSCLQLIVKCLGEKHTVLYILYILKLYQNKLWKKLHFPTFSLNFSELIKHAYLKQAPLRIILMSVFHQVCELFPLLTVFPSVFSWSSVSSGPASGMWFVEWCYPLRNLLLFKYFLSTHLQE